MANKIALQSVDSPRRELEWKLYLSKKLLDKGIDSVIGSKTQIKLIHENSENCIFVGRLDSVTARAKVDIDYLKAMERNNTKLFYLHDEGGFYFKTEYTDAVKKVYPESLLGSDVLQKIFFWGKKQADVFKSSSFEDKLVVTGSPRFDLLKSEYSLVDKSSIEKIEKKYGNYILVCTRFGAVNRVPDEPTTLSKRSLDIRIEGGQDRDVALDSMFKVWEKISFEFTFFIPAIARLAQHFSNINFVIRPHPAEKMSFYTESFSHFNNIFIDKDGDVRPFIKAAKLVIQSECTTGVEAELAMVPHINFRPAKHIKDFEGWDVAGVSDVGHVVDDYSALHAAVNKYIENGFLFEGSSSDVCDYLATTKKEINSSDLIVQEIVNFANFNKDLSKINNFLDPKAFTSKYMLMALKEKLRKYRRSLVQKNIIAKGDTKYFNYSPTDIKDIWRRYGGVDSCLSIKSGIVYIHER
jgi:surface carbohydrate biosynthesis protein